MKKTIKIILFLGLLAASSLNAKELLFDLRAQDYANTLKDTSITSKYKISDKIILETNLRKSKKAVYYYIDNFISGFCNLQINIPLKNWTLNSNIVYQSIYQDSEKYFTNKKRLIKFIDNTGHTIILEFYKDGFTINGKEFKAKINDEQLALNISKLDNKISFKINGQTIHTINSSNFQNLKFIDTDIWNWKFSNSYYDRLQDLKLFSND